MARPNRYPVVLAFRLDDAAASRLVDVSSAYGMPPAAFARYAVVERIGTAMALPAVRTRVLHADVLRELAGEFGRLGSLLNQIAKKLNVNDRSRLADFDDLRVAYLAALNAVVDALGGTRAP